MDNKWKDIWEKRKDNFSNIDLKDPLSVFAELKRIDGFDVVGGGIPRDALIKQHDEILIRMSKGNDIKSIFEVGCGSGADLYLFASKGMEVGGIDYSEAQIKIARSVFNEDIKELICGEAINIPVEIQYDAVLSNSVFSYFPSEDYARNVLNKISKKTKHSIGLIDVHDIEKKEQFEEYRKATVENYEELYKDLKKFFYEKGFFSEWAEQNGFEIEFYDSDITGYWNSKFVFDVYMYRK